MLTVRVFKYQNFRRTVKRIQNKQIRPEMFQITSEMMYLL